jgi:hypothetical protein
LRVVVGPVEGNLIPLGSILELKAPELNDPVKPLLRRLLDLQVHPFEYFDCQLPNTEVFRQVSNFDDRHAQTAQS